IVSRAAAPPNDLRIVVDAGNGAAGVYAWELFQKLGYLTFQLNCEPDDTYPHYFPNPSEKTAREALKRAVGTAGIDADIGLGFDGDGDRLGVVDGQGRDIWADRVLMILAEYYLRRHPGATVVFDVKCTKALIESVVRSGGRPLMWKTGHSYIKERMKTENAVLAGERSGHIFINDENRGYDDALYAAAVLLKIMAERKQKVEELLKHFPAYETSPEIHISCCDQEKYERVENLQRYFINAYGRENVCQINGARVEFPQFKGWALVRASSNLPELVMIAEADGRENLRRLEALLREELIKNGIKEQWQNIE
ncbi:MAG: phosphomannomutase/phosphoglucomutase, partial [Bacillota bacterium]